MTDSRVPLIAGLMPAGVAAYALRLPASAEAALEAIKALDIGRALAALPDRVAGAVAGRRASFLAGRWCALQALREVVPLRATDPIGIGESREPIWPAGAVGSITHTVGFALAAVASSRAVRAIGVDAERWFDDDAPARLTSELTVAGELEALIAQTGWPASRLLTLLFSAKESIYKCLFPEVRAHFGFAAARLEQLALTGGSDGDFVARLTRTLSPRFPAGLALQGRFACLDDVVITTLVLD